MGGYVLLLTSGEFASLNQTGDRDVDVIPVSIRSAEVFQSLDEARKSAKGIQDGVKGEFEIYSDYKVQAVLKMYSVE